MELLLRSIPPLEELVAEANVCLIPDSIYPEVYLKIDSVRWLSESELRITGFPSGRSLSNTYNEAVLYVAIGIGQEVILERSSLSLFFTGPVA